MSSHQGLAFCGGNFGNAFCVCKLLEVIMSLIILFIVIYDMIMRYRIEKQLNFFILICNIMILALISNVVYSFDHKIHAMNDLEGYLYDAYFGIIVYYVAMRLFSYSNPGKHRNTIKWVIHITFMIYNVLLLAILIESLVVYIRCEESWYIAADILGLLASIILVILGVIHTKKEKKKIQGLKNPQHYKNPLFSIWIWIAVNIFSEVCSFIESLFFTFNPQLSCTFSENDTVNIIIKFIFAALSFHLGMVATIIFFRKKYEQTSVATKISTPERLRKQSANIELIEQFETSKDENKFKE